MIAHLWAGPRDGEQMEVREATPEIRLPVPPPPPSLTEEIDPSLLLYARTSVGIYRLNGRLKNGGIYLWSGYA